MGLFARIFAWFRPALERREAISSVAQPEPELEIALAESDLFEHESAPNESGFRLKALGNGNETRRLPALQSRASPFDAATRRVDLDELARTLDARAASSRK